MGRWVKSLCCCAWGALAGCALVDNQVPVAAYASAAENHVLARFVAEARALSLARQLSTVDGVQLVLERGQAGVAIQINEPEGGFGGEKVRAEPFRDGWRAVAVARRSKETVAAMETLQVREVVASATAESSSAAAILARMRAVRELALTGTTDRGPGRFVGAATVLRIEYDFTGEDYPAADGQLEHALHRATVTLWGVAKLTRAADLSAEEETNVAEKVAMEHATAWEWDRALPALDQVLAARPAQVAYGLAKVAGLLARGQGQAAGAALEAAVGAAGGDGSDELRRAHERLRTAIGDGAWAMVNLALVARSEVLARQAAARGPGEGVGEAVISIQRSEAAAEPTPPDPPPATDTAATVTPETAPAAAPAETPPVPAKAKKKGKRGRKR